MPNLIPGAGDRIADKINHMDIEVEEIGCN